jgi:protein gp37
MADGTLIEWSQATWSPITGCSIESPGCLHCYAQTLAAGRLRNHPSRAGLTMPTKTGPVWTGEVRFNEQWLDQPLQWTKPRDIFSVAHGDLFHPNVPDEWIDRVFAVMILAHQHRFQVLTKRTSRMLKYLSGGRDLYQRVLNAARPLRNQRPHLGDVPIDDPGLGTWHKNIWLGTSVERQQEADIRLIPLEALAYERGWNTWVSYEPALGPVDWTGWEFIKWFVSGGESGPKARPAHPAWYGAARDFCVAHGIKYFHKQNGNWLHDSQADADGRVGFYGENENGGGVHDWPDGSYSVHLHKKVTGSFLDGREWKEMPA